MTHQIILHDFTSGGWKVTPHNAVPQGTACQRGASYEKKYFCIYFDITEMWKL